MPFTFCSRNSSARLVSSLLAIFLRYSCSPKTLTLKSFMIFSKAVRSNLTSIYFSTYHKIYLCLRTWLWILVWPAQWSLPCRVLESLCGWLWRWSVPVVAWSYPSSSCSIPPWVPRSSASSSGYGSGNFLFPLRIFRSFYPKRCLGVCCWWLSGIWLKIGPRKACLALGWSCGWWLADHWQNELLEIYQEDW